MTWTLRDRVVAVVFVLTVAAMIAVPLARVFDDEPGRFGWHMFSIGREVPDYTVTTSSGRVVDVDPADYLAGLRSDVSLDRLPGHLCQVIPDAAAVLVVSDGSETRVPCT